MVVMMLMGGIVMALVQQLRQKRNFTATEAEIAEYILHHQDEVANMTIGQLAEATYSSKAAVARMCAKLGLDGFRTFKVNFAVELERRRYERPDIDIDRPFSEHDGAGAVMRSINLIEKQALDACYAAVTPGSINRAARVLAAAQNIYCHAIGDTYISVTGFSNMLMKLGRHCLMMDRYGERMSMARGATAGDVALFVSYSGGTMPYLRPEIDTLKAQGCAIILISTLDECPGIDYFVTLPAHESATGKAGGFFSQTAIRYVLDSLYGTIYTLDLEHNQARKDRIEAAWQV